MDSKTTYENIEETDRPSYFDKDDKGIVETFINAKIIERSNSVGEDEEGCLSIPNLSQKIKRRWIVTIKYCDKTLRNKHEHLVAQLQE